MSEEQKNICDILAVDALTALAVAGIPPDVQELLVYGDPVRGIAPGALSKACAAIWKSAVEMAAE
jgi:hypothetical protein